MKLLFPITLALVAALNLIDSALLADAAPSNDLKGINCAVTMNNFIASQKIHTEWSNLELFTAWRNVDYGCISTAYFNKKRMGNLHCYARREEANEFNENKPIEANSHVFPGGPYHCVMFYL
ncbi:hypothetical protein BDF19DRAFT_440758 [Syncephalis fuscata]|nr:hypothetical protein BDF19DRAFT_440758 [Syncephalis fuscata]